MDSLVGYVATGVSSLTVGVLSKRFEPEARLHYWIPHQFFFDLKEPKVQLRTDSLTVQNLGRKPATNVEIIHKSKLDFYQLSPAVNYTESTSANGEFVLTIPSLGKNEFVTLQILSYTTAPFLLNVRSAEGAGQELPFQLHRVFPRWLVTLRAGLIIVGVGTLVYGLARAGILAAHFAGLLR